MFVVKLSGIQKGFYTISIIILIIEIRKDKILRKTHTRYIYKINYETYFVFFQNFKMMILIIYCL